MDNNYIGKGGAFFDDIRALTIPFALVLAQKGLSSLKKNNKSKSKGKNENKNKNASRKAPMRVPSRSKNAENKSNKNKNKSTSKKQVKSTSSVKSGKKTATKPRKVVALVKKSASNKKPKTVARRVSRGKAQKGGDCGCAHLPQAGGSDIMNSLSNFIMPMP